jgi:hypothetical protein
MMDAIEAHCCNEEFLGKLLNEDAAFSKAVGTWTTDQIGNDIALALQQIAAKHNVYDFSLGDLNAFKVPINVYDAVKMDNIDVMKYSPAEAIAKTLTVITAIVSYLIVPFVVGFVVGIMAILFEGVFLSILVALLTAGEATLLFGFGAIALLLAGGLYIGYYKNKEKINKWLMKQNLPKALRNKVNTDDFAKQFEKDRPGVVADAQQKMNDPKVADEMSRQIYVKVQPQIEARANQIKYVIENR